MVPTDDCCFFYEATNFNAETLMTPQGLCVDFPEVQDYRDVKLSEYGWFHGIGSFSCGKNVTLTLMTKDNIESRTTGALKVHDTEFGGSIDRA